MMDCPRGFFSRIPIIYCANDGFPGERNIFALIAAKSVKSNGAQEPSYLC
jgi:hypothetical protein